MSNTYQAAPLQQSNQQNKPKTMADELTVDPLLKSVLNLAFLGIGMNMIMNATRQFGMALNGTSPGLQNMQQQMPGMQPIVAPTLSSPKPPSIGRI